MKNQVIKIKQRLIKNDNERLPSEKRFLFKFFSFFRLFFGDVWRNKQDNVFNEYGLKLYCGKQGSGKSISMTEELERIRLYYPKVLIYTNYGYKHQDGAIKDWYDLLEIRSEYGVVFAIDEIQNEFSVYESRKFNQRLLSVVTQQRKQAIRILGTAQQFNRVTKPLREQTFEVVECVTLGGRWTFQKAFDAYEYNDVIDSPERKLKLRRLWRKNFVQTSYIRDLFDSFEVIETMQKFEDTERQKESQLLESLKKIQG